jgi:hypothetical protein
MASGLFIAHARAASRRGPKRNLEVQAAVAGAAVLFPDCY